MAATTPSASPSASPSVQLLQKEILGAFDDFDDFDDGDEFMISHTPGESTGLSGNGNANGIRPPVNPPCVEREETSEDLQLLEQVKLTLQGEPCHVSSGGGDPPSAAFRYASWLAHQEYYDDLRFANEALIVYDFGLNNTPVTIAQNRHVGKGGIVWDASYMLADHLITQKCTTPGTNVLELGAGTGLAGIALAAVGGCAVTLTDRAELVPLMIDNLERNQDVVKQGGGKVETPRTLEWSTDEDVIAPNVRGAFDVVLAADCVADIYDSSALLHTIHATLKPGGRAYLLSRVRLPEHIEGVMEEAAALFADAVVEDIKSANTSSHHLLVKLVRT